MSNNIPLFIVQFIEYLLEAKLAEIENRNTVGITNINSFSSKVYIPNEIEKIYKRRLEYLLLLPEKNEILDFIFLLTELKGRMTSEQYLLAFNENKAATEILQEKRIVKLDSKGEYVFVHETMYLFFNQLLLKKGHTKARIAKLLLSLQNSTQFSLSNLHIGKLYYWNRENNQAKSCLGIYAEKIERIENLSNLNVDISLYDYLYIIFSLYQKDKDKTKLLKNIITTRIYIALHHFSPTIAVNECDEALHRARENKYLANDKALHYAILAQKAHALLNAGQHSDGERTLNNLLSSLLVEPNLFDLGTKFDLYDRLCSINIKNNRIQSAENYNYLSLSTAKKKGDLGLEIIAHRTSSKLNFYINPLLAWESLEYVENLTKNGTFERIRTSNQVAILNYKMVYDVSCDYENIYKEASILLDRALKNTYSMVALRCYITMAACCFFFEKEKHRYKRTKELISNGIDSSIRFGMANYIWQFYNLLAIVDMKLDFEPDHVKKLFNTVYLILAKQNLLFFGTGEMCYGSIQAISNVGFFLQKYSLESEFNYRMSAVSYEGSSEICDYNCDKPSCGNFCPNNKETLRIEYKNAQNKRLLYSKIPPEHLLRDPISKYFIVLL